MRHRYDAELCLPIAALGPETGGDETIEDRAHMGAAAARGRTTHAGPLGTWSTLFLGRGVECYVTPLQS